MQLIDQVNANEELVIRDVPENVDRYASLLSGMTDDAIIYSQKKVGLLIKTFTVVKPGESAYTDLKGTSTVEEN